MKWSTEKGPMGVTRDQVVLDWLKQPGNYDSFMKADGRSKMMGTVTQNKRDVVKSTVCVSLQNAGFSGITPHAVVIKLTQWLKNYHRAYALAKSGASQEKVKKVFPDYYDLVNHIESDTCQQAAGDTSDSSICEIQPRNIIRGQRLRQQQLSRVFDADNIDHQQANQHHSHQYVETHSSTRYSRARATRTTIRYQNRNESSTRMQDPLLQRQHYDLITRLLQQQQQLLDQQARQSRLQEIELHISLIERLTEAGFTKEEIAEQLAKYQ